MVQNSEPTQFKEGISGNPNGRPKGSRNMRSILNEMLSLMVEKPKDKSGNTPTFVEDWCKENKIPIREYIILQDIVQAMRGNEHSKKRIWEYIQGQPVQHVINEDVKDLDVKQTLQRFADKAGITLEEYCEREGININDLSDTKPS